MNATTFVRACPKCGQTILWCDGEPAPTLVLAGGKIIGCARCHRFVGPRLTAPKPAPTRAATPAPPPMANPQEVKAKLASEGAKVVSILSDGYDLLTKAADFYDRLKGKRR